MFCTAAIREEAGGQLDRAKLVMCSAILAVEMLYQSADQRNVEFSVARHPADIFSITYDAPNDLG